MTAIFESDPLSVGRERRVELVPGVSREAAEFVRRDRTIRYGFAARGGLIIRSGSREQKVEPLAAESECRSNACWRAATTLYRKLRASNAKDREASLSGNVLRPGDGLGENR